MRPASQELIDGLAGSRQVETLVVHAWYDGDLVAADLPVTDWQISADATRDVPIDFSATITDGDGLLSPWDHTDPVLGVAGTRLQLAYRVDGQDGVEQVPMETLTITDANPHDTWRRIDGRWVSTGSTVPVAAQSLLADLNVDLPGPDAPPPRSTRVGEIRRMVGGLMPVVVDPAVGDVSAGSEAYESTRLAVVQDHARALGARIHVDPSGTLLLLPDLAPTQPVWTVRGGPDGAMIDTGRSFRKDDIINAAVAEGSGGDVEIVERAMLLDGPLRWGGPAGFRPRTHASPLYVAPAAALLGAQRVLERTRRERGVDFVITTLPMPLVELGDLWRILVPTRWGVELDVTGPVTAWSLSGTAGTPEVSTVTVTVPSDVVAAAVEAIRNA